MHTAAVRRLTKDEHLTAEFATTWPTYFAARGVDTLNLKEVFADRVSDDRRQHKELITCGATGMLREPLSYSRR